MKPFVQLSALAVLTGYAISNALRVFADFLWRSL